MESHEYRLLKAEIAHVKELLFQYNEQAKEALDKALKSTDEKFLKTNEFREQQKDLIANTATKKETDSQIDVLNAKFYENMKSVTERYEANTKSTHDKMDASLLNLAEKLEIMKKALEDKRDTLYAGIQQRFEDSKTGFEEKLTAGLKNIDDKITANIKVETAKFIAVDTAMDTKINANADVSNKGLEILGKGQASINLWKENVTGRITVIVAVGGFIIAMVMVLFSAFIYSLFR